MGIVSQSQGANLPWQQYDYKWLTNDKKSHLLFHVFKKRPFCMEYWKTVLNVCQILFCAIRNNYKL